MAKETNTNSDVILAYSIKAKEKVPVINPVIEKMGNRYFCKGKDAAGNNLSAIMGEETAKEHVKAGRATKKGW